MTNTGKLGFIQKHGFYRDIKFNGIFLCRQILNKNGVPKGIFSENRSSKNK